MAVALKLRVTVDLSAELGYKVLGHAKKRNEKVEDTAKYIIAKYFKEMEKNE